MRDILLVRYKRDGMAVLSLYLRDNAKKSANQARLFCGLQFSSGKYAPFYHFLTLLGKFYRTRLKIAHLLLRISLHR